MINAFIVINFVLDSQLQVESPYGMQRWVVVKYVRKNGKCPIDEWCASKEITAQDRAALEAKVSAIEAHQGQLPPEWVKKYQTTDLYEMKVSGNRKKLRPLCLKDDGRKIVLLSGAIEKDSKLSPGDIQTAENLKKDYEGKDGSTKPFFEN